MHDLAQVQELFEAALNRPREARREYLDELDIEPGLREDVWSLLEAHAAEGPLDQVAAALAHVTDPGPESAEADDGRSPPVHVGPYRIHEAVGKGGMATVYRARRDDDESTPWVAVKVVRADADSERVRRRFMAERQILARLDHGRIARFLDDGLTSDGRPYLVTEFVEGERLDRYCERVAVDLERRLTLFLDVCEAVEYAHGRGVVHRDLKPDNVLVTADGEVRLLDFGIAKILDRSAFPGIGKPTTTGVHVLTLSYASPEQLRGDPITPSSDVYQLGLLLVRMVTGRVPPVHERSVEPFTVQLAGRTTSPTSTQDEKRLARLEAIITRALALRPGSRPASVEELRAAVEAALADSAHDLAPSTTIEPGQGDTLDLRLVGLGLLVVAVLIVAAVALMG